MKLKGMSRPISDICFCAIVSDFIERFLDGAYSVLRAEGSE
jgi:hypothetical protein